MSEKKKDFREKYNEVYKIVAMIPEGKIVTYGQLAWMVGGITARQAGYAMKTAPPGLPAHRVVNSLGKLSPEYVFGGQDAQRALLEKEGITFTAAGNICVKKHLWGNE
ncbi:DNA base-flipping protein [Methanimicrococcus hongohii]|uniref:DNA base-flipping protein n=1 Tax=Methanimicrococcus hongohii TaxID=3028295 RepID=A0AA96V055_9EURY|nr:MGMT family protein [Methanimicrococcus sp. Hf6]WNY23849.1 DNA base-flipping protein [Methanimicrococcus sp. Hf6]